MRTGTASFILLVLMVASATCVPLVSADDWSYRGSSGLLTSVNGDSSKRITVQQETTYWYSPSRNQFKEHVHAWGGAQYYNDNYGVKQWLPTYGYYGVYGVEDGLWGMYTTFGDKSVYHTSTILGKTQRWGYVTLVDADVYRSTGSSGSTVSVTVAGNVGNKGATISSTSWPK